MHELYAPRRSAIHDLDARVKVIFTLAFILFLNLTPIRAWPAYVLFWAVSLSLSLVSKLGIGFVLKRALLAAPFVLAAIPLVFTGPPPVVSIQLGNGISLVISLAGFARFMSIAMKSWISVQAAILLAATTRFPDLMLALQQLHVPKLLVAIVSLMWRYLFVIREEVTRMLRARSSRSAANPSGLHPGGSISWRARTTGGMAGSLLLRSMERSDRVYAAMLSRGYTGELPACETAGLSLKDRRILRLGMALLVFLWLVGIITGG